MENSPFISLRSIAISYEKNKKVIHKLNLDIEEGSFVSIVGASGSGKTSILNLIGGFIKPDQGKILLNGIDIKDIPPHQRPTSTVFQDYALFPHMNVWDNIAFGLKKMTTNLENVSQETINLVKQQEQKSILKSHNKIQSINKEIKKFVDLFIYYQNKWKLDKKTTFFYKPKFFYLKTLKNRILDLDYWKSYWEYYPILAQKRLKEKHLQRPLNQEEISKKINSIINLIGLNGKETADINTLSGGTKQKVALARSLVTEPKILLLDEPLSSIDKKIRETMQLELKRLHKKLKITFLLITHDQKEALILSDKIVVLNQGYIEQIGTPSEIYDTPVNPWVANFMGKANLFQGTYLKPGQIHIKGKIFNTSVMTGFSENESVIVMIRPEDYDVVPCDKGNITVEVISSIYKGQLWELKCKFYDELLLVESFNEVKIGETIGLFWDSIDVHVMKKFQDI